MVNSYAVNALFHNVVLVCTSLILLYIFYSLRNSLESCSDWRGQLFNAINVIQWTAVILATLFFYPLRVEDDTERCELRYLFLGFTARFPLRQISADGAAAGRVGSHGLAARLFSQASGEIEMELLSALDERGAEPQVGSMAPLVKPSRPGADIELSPELRLPKVRQRVGGGAGPPDEQSFPEARPTLDVEPKTRGTESRPGRRSLEAQPTQPGPPATVGPDHAEQLTLDAEPTHEIEAAAPVVRKEPSREQQSPELQAVQPSPQVAGTEPTDELSPEGTSHPSALAVAVPGSAERLSLEAPATQSPQAAIAGSKPPVGQNSPDVRMGIQPAATGPDLRQEQLSPELQPSQAGQALVAMGEPTLVRLSRSEASSCAAPAEVEQLEPRRPPEVEPTQATQPAVPATALGQQYALPEAQASQPGPPAALFGAPATQDHLSHEEQPAQQLSPASAPTQVTALAAAVPEQAQEQLSPDMQAPQPSPPVADVRVQPPKEQLTPEVQGSPHSPPAAKTVAEPDAEQLSPAAVVLVEPTPVQLPAEERAVQPVDATPEIAGGWPRSARASPSRTGSASASQQGSARVSLEHEQATPVQVRFADHADLEDWDPAVIEEVVRELWPKYAEVDGSRITWESGKAMSFLEEFFQVFDHPMPKVPKALFSELYEETLMEQGDAAEGGLDQSQVGEFAKRVWDWAFESFAQEMRTQRKRHLQRGTLVAHESHIAVHAEQIEAARSRGHLSSRSTSPRPRSPATRSRVACMASGLEEKIADNANRARSLGRSLSPRPKLSSSVRPHSSSPRPRGASDLLQIPESRGRGPAPPAQPNV